MRTFVILDTPPTERPLTSEPVAEDLCAVISDDFTILKRNDNDPATVGQRIRKISGKPLSKVFRSFQTALIGQFVSFVTSGDRVVVLKVSMWEQYLVA